MISSPTIRQRKPGALGHPFGTSAASWFNGTPGFGSKKGYLPENTSGANCKLVHNSIKFHLPKIPPKSLQRASLTTAKGCRLTFKPSDLAQGPSAWKAGHGVEPIGECIASCPSWHVGIFLAEQRADWKLPFFAELAYAVPSRFQLLMPQECTDTEDTDDTEHQS